MPQVKINMYERHGHERIWSRAWIAGDGSDQTDWIGGRKNLRTGAWGILTAQRMRLNSIAIFGSGDVGTATMMRFRQLPLWQAVGQFCDLFH